MPALAALLDLVLPRRCVGCGSGLGLLCPRCLPSGALVPAGGPALPIVAAGAYDGALRAALLAYKERGRRDLAGPLGALLARAVGGAAAAGRAPPDDLVLAYAVPGDGVPDDVVPYDRMPNDRMPNDRMPNDVVLVPVPSARSVAAARGGDHVLRLARRASRASGLRVAPDALALVRAVRDSAGLGVAERSTNLAHAMAARPAPPRRSALIIDDIVTTGATLGEAARALAAAGWPVVGAAVVAATPRRAAGRVAMPIGSAQP